MKSRVSDSTTAVVHELADRFAQWFDEAEVEQCVEDAARDLAGSISSESLPEMATRLAAIRLVSRIV